MKYLTKETMVHFLNVKHLLVVKKKTTAVHVEGRLDAHQQLDGGTVGHADGAGHTVGPVTHLTPLMPTLNKNINS